MSHFSRILPFVWPSRHRLFVSFFFAGLVAILWGGNLSIVFPVVKVLLQGESLQSYVSKEISDRQGEIAHYRKEIAQLDAEAAQLTREKDRLERLTKRVRSESKLAAVTQRLAQLEWLHVYVTPRLPTDQFDTFAFILAVLLVLTVIKLFCQFVEEVLIGGVVQLTILRIRKQLFRKTLQLDLQTLRKRGTPDLMSRLTYDIETLGNGLSLLGGKLVREPLKAAACITFAFWVNWRLTLLCLLFVPLALLTFHRMGRQLKKASHRSMEAMARIYKVLEESLEAIKVVIAFDGARRHRRKHHIENKVYFQKSMSITVIDSLTGPATELLGMAAVSLAMLPGAYLVLRETNSVWGIRLSASQMDVAELSLLYALLAGVLDPVRKLSSIFSKLKRASAAADRVFELMDLTSLVQDPPRPVPLPAKLEQLEFRNVRFHYLTEHHNRPPALDGANLTVRAGEVVAIVGENGSGKSTLVNLLPRYYDVNDGSVLLDEIDLRDCSLQELRSRIAVVTQETLLFDDTITANILYGNPLASQDEVLNAAEQAHVLAFARQLPDGLETRLGEKGSALSGGQRQRVALARAMIRNPEILILDEATSAIDAQSEVLIHAALKTFVQGRTTFIITHSVTPSVLELVTRIVVMEHGRVVASGPHEMLLANCPLYGRLYQSQGAVRAA